MFPHCDEVSNRDPTLNVDMMLGRRFIYTISNANTHTTCMS